MIMPIAIAKEGFIDINEIGFGTPQNYDFEETLRLIFNFEDRDLQFFDGNTCRLINSYDPTNSIFIYENQQGKFLYKITSASPVIHKNNMIWLCNCYKMEDFLNINKILTQEQEDGSHFGVVANIQKNIGHYFINNETTLNNEATDPNIVSKYLYKIKIKNNFETSSIDKFFIGLDSWNNNQNFTLKIKCLVNPTTENLTTTSKDGSFNFLFPIKASGYSQGELPKITSKITNGTTTISIADIISKYSENIKSIELLPFNCANVLFGVSNFTIENSDEDILTISPHLNAKFTDCGIFVEQGFTNFFDLIYINKEDYPLQLIVGGGIKGFLQTPIGNINLDFSTIYYNDFDNIVCCVKEDGFKIDGICKADVSPMYLNFYTDNAGQVFIQNLTTNAQELRQLERETNAKYEEQQHQYVLSQFTEAVDFNILDPTTWWGSATSGLKNATQNEFNKSKIEREYERSIAEYRDKKQTQSLLASLQGKQISGNYSIIDFLISLNSFPFVMFFEKNFFRQKIVSTNIDNLQTSCYVVQQDYDYSTGTEQQNMFDGGSTSGGNITQPILIIGNENTNTRPHCWSDITRFVINIFSGTPSENGVIYRPLFQDEIGLNFTIQFKFSNFINSSIYTFEDMKNQKETQILNFQVRTIKKR